MVAMVITGVVLVATYGALFRSQTAATRVQANVETRQNSRAAVQLLEREVRMSGSGWGRNPLYGWDNGVATTRFAIAFGYGGSTASSDSIGVVAGWDLVTTLRAALPNRLATTPIQCVSSAGFSVGDFVVVTDGTLAHMFHVTGISGNDLLHAATSVYNVSTPANSFPPIPGYPIGTQVYRMSMVSYKVDAVTYRKPVLVRWEHGRGTQVVAYNVKQFIVNYELQGGGFSRNPAAFTAIDKVVPVVLTQATVSGKTVVDSAWASVRPRTF
jgi:hypothetical protein